MNLENKLLVKLSVGIGRNITEAEEALRLAKKNKFIKDYNIEIYKGPKKEDKKTFFEKQTIGAYLRLKEALLKSKKSLDDLELFKFDPKTNLLNRLGYHIEKEKLILKKTYDKDKRFIMLFDADSMHDLNKKYGYQKVDVHLRLIGKALKENIRDVLDKNDQVNLRKIKDILYNRRYDSAGDEFIIDLSCNKKDLFKIARRYLEKCYNYQLGLDVFAT